MSWLMSSNLVFTAGNHKTETWKSSISVNEISGKLHNDQPYRPYRVEISINFFSSVAPVEESELIKDRKKKVVLWPKDFGYLGMSNDQMFG